MKVGDYVMLTVDNPDGNKQLRTGDFGIVVHANSYSYAVDWLRDVSGHDCEGKCRYGNGWVVNDYEVKAVSPEFCNDIDEACLIDDNTIDKFLMG